MPFREPVETNPYLLTIFEHKFSRYHTCIVICIDHVADRYAATQKHRVILFLHHAQKRSGSVISSRPRNLLVGYAIPSHFQRCV